MVFESVVVDVLNRFLGDYVVNLDSSQLKLGIWGGDAVLTNLEIKENALSELDIPFKVRAGHIGRLELKIPWKNLYTQSVEATLDGVYLLIVPTASIKYDAVKEEKQLQEARQRELHRIEETKQKAAEQENPNLEKQDTFVEKLVTQVIKNVQVKISNIHVRYEDDVTNPNCPLSFGVSLKNLSLQTADENWNPSLLDENSRLFFKLVQLDSLFAYWNVNSILFSNHSADEALGCLQSSMESHSSFPVSHDFIFRPISADAKLRMNPRSDVDFSSPRLDLMVNLSEVAIELNRPQYISILELLGSVDLMSRNLPYRKYRPALHVHKNTHIWWNYVITAILEVDVKPRLHMWSWQHIRRHRCMVKRYRELYKTKITSKKPSEELLKQLEEPEKTLDIFNITLVRQQAEMEASKAGLRIYRPGLKMEEEESQGWLNWMWNWGGEADTQTKDVKTGGFDELLTSAEKAKLYTAIGYSEIATNPNLPKDFEDMKVNFHMERLSVSIKDNKDKNEIIRLTVEELQSTLAQRPGAQAIKITARLSLFEVTGLASSQPAPTLLSSRKAATGTGTPLLCFLLETNPVDETANQRLHVESQPLEIIYDAMTVNSMSAFFMPPDDLQLDELTNATLMKLEQFRDRTSTGLMYVIETQKILDLKVNLMASYVIIPQTGFYNGNQNILLLDLGHFQMSSQSRKHLPQLSVCSSNIEDIMSRAYDSFDIQLSSLQFLYSKPDGDWKKARKQKQSLLHILEPVDLKMDFSRAMVVTDSRMAKYKMFGELPLLSLRISDVKLRSVLELVESIPLPESRPAARSTGPSSTPKPKQFTPQLTPRRHLNLADQRSSLIFESCETISITSLGSEEDLFYDAPSSPIGEREFFPDNPMPLRYADLNKRKSLVKEDAQKNMTDFIMKFEISEFSVQLCRLSGGQEVTVLHLDIDGLGTELKLRTFDMTSNTFLREICLKCPEYMDSEDKQVQLITTLDNTEVDLLTLEYIKADKTGPEFKSQHNNTEQLIKVTFSSLDLHLHTEALLNTMNFLNNLLPPSTKKEGGQEELPTIPEEDEVEGEREGEKKEEATITRKKSTRSKKFADVVNLHIRADMRCLKVFIRGQNTRISEISIEGLVSEVLMRKKEMEVLANLKNIVILDCDKDAFYKKAVSIADEEVFAFRMVNYTDATEGDAYLDMSKVDTSVTLTVGCIQVIFLNKFVSSILAFINNFQEAKEALAEVTVHAAEKAASGVKELAERSTRIALNVHFNAPVIFLPQSSSSSNVIVADLGRLSVKNHFSKQPFKSDAKIPPVVDIMTVRLTDLKMYRATYINEGFQGETQLLMPVSLDLKIQRNLSSNWYHSIPDIEITAHLKPMSLILSQDDMIVVLRTLSENLSEKSDAVQPPTSPPTTDHSSDSVSNKGSQSSGTTGPPSSNTVVTAAVVETQKNSKLKNTLKLDFKFDSMTLVVYSPNGNALQLLDSHDEQLKLAEFTLGTISTSLQMFSDSSMKASVRLAACLLDDKRPNIKMVTPRMMAMRPGAEQNMMVEVNYRQGREGTTLDTVVQDVYLCASMEFLLTVADIFLNATQQGFAQVPQHKSSTGAGDKKNINASVTSKESTAPPAMVSKTEMNVVVRNPEIVFVADLTRADAPALVMTTQCELLMKSGAEGSNMTAVINDLKVVACPFLIEKRKNNVTTVLQPCQVFFQSTQTPTTPQAMEVSINALTLKVSPIIINTVITIQSALTPTAETPEELDIPVSVDLWEKRSWKELKLWFLEEEGDEDTRSLAPLIPQGESLQVTIKSICLTLEAGVGHRTVPMLLVKSSFLGDVTNWSTLINLHSELNLEVHYYNEVMGVWEPLLEPLEDESGDGFRSWRLELKMKKKPTKFTLSDEVDYNVPDYKTVITISSKDQLNITLSKFGLAMLSNLGTAFAEAAKQTAECFQKDGAPFVVKNRLGLPVSVRYSEMFCPIGQQSANCTVELEDGETLGMDYSTTTDSDQFSAMISLSGKDYYIQPTPVGHTSASVIPLIKVGRGMYSVMHNDSGVTRFLVCQIYSVEGSKYIKIRSPFQIINHFTIPFKVFEGSTCLGTAFPTEEFCVPLDSYRSELSLQPITEDDAGDQFECSEGFSYEDVSHEQPESRLQQTCRRCGNQDGVMMINIVPFKDAVTFKHNGGIGENFDVPFVLHLWPSILLRNLLPYPIAYDLKDSGVSPPEATLDPGHSAQLHTAVINQSRLGLRLLNYLAQDWSAEYSLQSDQEEITFIVFQSLREDDEDYGEGTERTRAELDIAVHVKYDLGETLIAIHSPYWMVNNTGRLLQYKADDIHRKHPLDYDMPLLFSFKPRYFLKNNKVRLMISDSEASDDFSLDTVGSHGDVKCKGRYKDYLVGVKIDASSFSLTRIVTFVPFYMLVNRTKHSVFICEEGQDNWSEAQPEQSAIPFWPEAKRLKIKVEGCLSPPRTIDFTRPENCLLLHLDNSVGGIIVDVNLSDHSATIRFSEYHDGAAPFLIINHTKDQTLKIHQSSQEITEQEELEPGRAVHYTWAKPTGSRELCWNCGTYNGTLKSEEDLREDINNEGKLFVISFYEGLQRVVLFTEEQRIYKLICESEKVQLAEQEIILSLKNMGVSLVNNSNSQEVSFIGITSSDVVWELKPKKKNRWKTLSTKEAEMLENSFKKYIECAPVDNAIVDLENSYQVSFTPNGMDMQMLQPCAAPLRRHFLPGVKVEYSVSPRQRAYRVQIHRIQIQNQLPGAIFPYVFYPVKLPKSITMDSEPKPLTDISIVTRAAGHSDISRIKYFKVLIQEMDLKLDLGFLYAILDLFTPENASIMTSEQEVELFEKDIEYIKTELNHVSAADTSPISLYEYFHISPIKLHLSFSLSTGGEDGLKAKRDKEIIPVQSLNLLLKSIGATLTDVQDVVFKLAFFELTFQFCTTQQLQWEVIRHYSKQAIKQMYVLVLGLDVLGNPFGLIRGLSEGVEAFFYEPYQGAIQGPEEFVEGMALGVKALVGGAVGGIAGAASRITGAMAKGVAAITMDEEYQQKRREAMNKQPSGLREGLTRGGKGLVSGFVSGITGIVTKPIKGAQKEGAAGFFKGLGKGLVGAVARPTGGIIDMASSTFQGIKRAAETSQDIESLRPPRFIHEDGVIRPYKEREGLGSQMLQKIENGRFAKYKYFAHAKVNESDFLMITKRGIFFVTKGTFGQLTCEWQYLFDEFTKDPAIVEDRRLRIEAKERVKSVFHAKEFGKIINFKTPEIATWVLTKLEDARDSLPKY
ncbi:putative vacuolar protein sorting-associated protein 13A [Scophthalmus maximus]|uniref:Putative vacuolar protein sorting-associated protein 13A n=1 Tax=Scophthalmus maximus TaxID=52904 RepID=A0A2U9BUI3_SCOMX|nr:vacuolar protein sorting-associated protein 13A isoform X2 [Scophthalmus maximus]AWP07199.1 putative vacuolar protein sorting-associated protein 13A [Scophthalmus maximus]